MNNKSSTPLNRAVILLTAFLTFTVACAIIIATVDFDSFSLKDGLRVQAADLPATSFEQTAPLTTKPSLQENCEQAGGQWLSDFTECEYTDRSWCMNNGGEFNGCGSACRHDLNADICTLQCVPFCVL